MKDFLRLGLFNWFPMREGAKVLFIGKNKILGDDLRRRGLNVSALDSVEELTNNLRYDYIIVVDGDIFFTNFENNNIDIKNALNTGGHFLIACNNRLALRNFVGDSDLYSGCSFDGIENYCSYTDDDLKLFLGRCFARNEIIDFVHRMGFNDKQYRGYSIFPGLEMPQLIYSWDYLPREDLESRYTPLYNDARRIFINETNVSESLINNGMFHTMANAYLIDCSLDSNFYEFNQITTSMERGEENATATIIQKDGIVIKKALYPNGNILIDSLITNMNALQNREISTVAFETQKYGVCDGTELSAIQMQYIDAPLAMEYLRKLLLKDTDVFKKAVCKFLDTILSSSDIIQNEQSELGPVFEKVYFDMVPINCFVIDGEFVFFDQEYEIKDYPINVVLMRVLDLVYKGNKNADAIFPMSYFIDKYNLADKIQIYRNMSTNYLNELKHSSALTSFHGVHKTNVGTINLNRQKMQYDVETYISLFINYLKDIAGRKVFLFGSGLWAQKFIAEYGDSVQIEAMLDNNPQKWGTSIAGICVKNPQDIIGLSPSSYKIIVCVKQYSNIIKQLKFMGVCNYGIYDPNIDVEGLMGTRCDSNIAISHKVSDIEKNNQTGKKPYHIGFVAGVFDLFHIGHLNLLKRAKEQCDILLVGVVSDEQASSGKKHSPYVCEQERLEIVKSNRYVDKAFIMPVVSSGARDIYKKYHFDVMFSGDDYKNDTYWLEEQEWLRERDSDIVFFPYTKSTSSTKLKRAIEGRING